MPAPQLFDGHFELGGVDHTWKITAIGLTGLYAEGLNRSVESFLRSWSPRNTRARMDLPAYVELAYARQCLQLALAAQDSSVSNVHRFVVELERSLASLEKAHPRFTYPHSVAISAVQLAGELLVDDTMYALEEIHAALPKPLKGPGAAETYIVIDDYQSTEDFQASQLPDRDAFAVFVVDDLDPPEFEQSRRVVFANQPFSPADAPFLTVDRILVDGTLTLTLTLTDEGLDEPWLLLRDLRSHIDGNLYTSARTHELSAVEYYTELAYSTSCAEILLGHPRAHSELTYRRELLAELCLSLSNAKKRNPELAVVGDVAGASLRACERLEQEESADLASAILHLLPPNLRRRFPRSWDGRRHGEIVDTIMYGLLGEFPDLVRVADCQTVEEFEERGLPDRRRYEVDPLGPDITPAHLEPLHCFVFAALEEEEGSCV
ncbi:hypothetical protein G7Y29_00240 [Corynebacterium qintianiae]|uniref:Uncharacterized protein n=1 Tax=Corynebacterium qintianiae TaxID=2709392 RepID=A0A7T0KM67_9CORY|nr:hypothetical protein [Corynebacterium qintianiae]QPK83303.1 hypothetical protein G7Y29_00240 [Corynebacterium qintianiae]